MRVNRLLTCALGPAAMALLLAGCPPKTQMGAVSSSQLQEEQLKQQQLVITSGIKEQQRLSNVAYPLLKAAVPVCGDKHIATRSGLLAVNAWIYNKDFQGAARSLGYGDTLVVAGVTTGSAADRAGIKVGDRLVEVSHAPAPTGKGAAGEFFTRLTPGTPKRGEPLLASHDVPIRLRRADSSGTRDVDVQLQSDTVCQYVAYAYKNDALNAWADGQQVVVTTAMLRFAASDDELAVVVSHELAHNAMRHMDAKKKGAILGGILGAALDVAAATQGINTGGGFSNSGAAVGGNAYSQDFEREADYVGMYILARSGRPYADSPNFWRRMAQESPGSIKYASTHPTSAERFIRLDRAAAEIRAKVEAGKPLLPEKMVPGTDADTTKTGSR